MVSTAPRWYRSVRRRPAAFLAVLLLAAGAVLVSAVTPMLVGAVSAVSLRQTVDAAPFPQDGVSVTAVARPDAGLRATEVVVETILSNVASTSDRLGAAQQVDEIQVVPRLFGPGRAPFASRLSIAPDACAGVRISGRCPTFVSDGLLAASVARSTGWTIGTRIVEKLPDPGGGSASRTIGEITVVGTYDDRDGIGAALADPTRLLASAPPRPVSNVVVGASGWETFNAPAQVTGAIRIAHPVEQGDVRALRAAVTAAKQSVLDGAAAEFSANATTRLGELLDAIGARQAAAAVLAAPVGLAAVLLAWFALGAVSQRTARSRAAEWGVGRMRGARLRAWFAFVFVEPMIAIALGTVTGYGAALLVARLAAELTLGTAQDIAPFAPTVLSGAGLAVAGSVVALAAASVRAALLPLPQLLQDTAEPRRSSRASFAVQVAAVAIAIAVVWAALTTPSFGDQQLGLLLPAILALVASLVVVRSAVLVARRASRRAPRSLTGLVVGRGLARAPSVLVAAQLVLVSAAMASCALQLGLLSAGAQTERAQLEVGAARVLTVQAPAGAALLDVVRRADPGGRAAMAALQVPGRDGVAGDKVLAVDTQRLQVVQPVRPDWQGGFQLARLRSDDPELRLVGTRLTMDVGSVVQDALDTSTGPTAVQLTLTVGAADGWRTIPLGPLRAGRLNADLPCPSGCQLIGIGLRNAAAYDQPWSARFTVTAISTERQQAGELRPWLQPRRWRDRLLDQHDPARPAKTSAIAAATGMTVTATDVNGPSTTLLEPAVGPALVPAVVGGEASLVEFPGIRSAVVGTSLGGTPILLDPVARVVAVPRGLRTGVLVDLRTMLRSEDPSLIGAEQQVWLAPTGQQAVTAALRHEGVRILRDEPVASAIDAGLSSAPHRALLVAAVTALAGVVFGLLALSSTRLIDMGERRREWAVLRLTGVPARRLRRIAGVQIAVPAMLGSVLGVTVGSVAASLIAGRLPLLVGETPGPLLDTAVPIGPLTALAGLLVLLVLVVAVVMSAAEVEGPRPRRPGRRAGTLTRSGR